MDSYSETGSFDQPKGSITSNEFQSQEISFHGKFLKTYKIPLDREHGNTSASVSKLNVSQNNHKLVRS